MHLGEFKACAAQILHALAYLHEIGIYHGNLTADNVFVGRSSTAPQLTAKVANFTKNAHDITTGIELDMTSLLKLFLQLLMGSYFERDRDLFENILGLGDEPQLFLIQLEGKMQTDEKQAYDLSLSSFLVPREEDCDRILPLLSAAVEHAEASLPSAWDSNSLPDTADCEEDENASEEITAFQCVIGTRFVSLRKVVKAGNTQYWLNLSELLLAANMSQSRRSALRKEYSGCAAVEGRASRAIYWILYSTGRSLIEQLGFQHHMQTLYARASNTAATA